MARARRRKSKQSNKLTYYIIGAAVLILIIFAFPNIGKFTATLTDSGSGVEIELITPDREIVPCCVNGVINFTFRNVQDFDTLSFTTYLPNGALVSNGILLNVSNMYPGGPLASSNTNVVIGGDSQFGTNATTLNFQGTNGVNISQQNISLKFSGNGTNLSKIVISNILFGDSNGDAIALFSNISRHDVIPANLPPTVRINSPSSGSSWPHTQAVRFNISMSDSDGSISSFGYWLDGNSYSPPFGNFGYWRSNITIGNHTFTAKATDDDGANTTVSTSFEVYNGTVPTSAAVAVISSPQSQQTYYVGEDIFFNGSSSYSINSSIASYNWASFLAAYWPRQGPVYNNSATFTQRRGRSNAGNYSVHLNVTDNNGAIGFANLRIQVTALGDVNGDGSITGADVTASEWLSVGVNRNYATQNADTNQDSSTNSLDITGVERILLR
jgi:hypothetical protein